MKGNTCTGVFSLKDGCIHLNSMLGVCYIFIQKDLKSMGKIKEGNLLYKYIVLGRPTCGPP